MPYNIKNDHLDYMEFNRKKHGKKRIIIENFILEACYVANERDIDINGKTITSKIEKLQEYHYQVKRDEYLYSHKL